MIHTHLVEDMLAAPEGWQDTEAQSQLRACLVAILSGHDEVTTIIIAGEVIEVMRDHFMGGAAGLRRSAARAARETGMMPQEIATATRQTPATVARLLTESRPA